MKKKYYAVKIGRIPGVYTTWEECREQVHAFSGATYKSFNTNEEAVKYINSPSLNSSASDASSDSYKQLSFNFTDPNTVELNNDIYQFDIQEGTDFDFSDLEENEAVAYVDGSFNVETGEYGSGIVFFCKGVELHYSYFGVNEELASMRNVAGEIKASEIAMQYAFDTNIKKLTIYHDYEGIAKWCTGEWKTNKEGTKAYKEFYLNISSSIEIAFVKVKGHSKDFYNDLADELAKKLIFD